MQSIWTNYWNLENSSSTRTSFTKGLSTVVTEDNYSVCQGSHPRPRSHLDPADFGSTSDPRSQSSRSSSAQPFCPVACSRSPAMLALCADHSVSGEQEEWESFTSSASRLCGETRRPSRVSPSFSTCSTRYKARLRCA
ncbi:unnamed protein product [Trichogramma brassicae]|uniref:Uncharacterized protein n=1 Tax=Trichogramma brassicae TaxID=86971 RepID=A0A6H5IXG6_9HYME|nr:unnamed protein product [Trichogramma brassicae]